MKRLKYLLLILFLILAVCSLFAACLSTDQTKDTLTRSGTAPPEILTAEDNKSNLIPNSSSDEITLTPTALPIINGTGIILFQDLEGGAYIIKDDSGHHYQPLSLPPDFKINGTRVSYQLHPVQDIVSIIMSGDPVEVISIEQVEGNRVANRSEPLISLEKAGGTSDSYEELKIFTDKQGEVTKWAQSQSMNISDSEMDILMNLCNKTDFATIKTQSMSVNPSPNALVYTIRYLNQTIKATSGSIPNQIDPLISELEGILDKHTISPISANKSLENTAWYLTSYLRNDGIQVKLQNSTKISAIFGSNNTVTGSSGCNSYTAQYNLTGTNLSFSRIAVTRMACIDQATMEAETTYLKLLEQVASVSGHEKNLTMSNQNNSNLLTYFRMN